MFGDVKKVARATRRAASDLVLAARDPAAARRFDRLSREMFRPDESIFCRPRQGLVYVEVAKAASRTIHAVLGRTRKMRSMGIGAFFALADDDDTLAFTFVRNPYTRLVSCYLDKFERFPVSRRIGCHRDAHRFFGRELKRLDQREPLPFSWFVEMAIATNRTGTDGHWLQMDRLVPHKTLRLDHVGKVERFEHDFRPIAAALGRDDAPLPRFNRTQGEAAECITPDLRRKIYAGYQTDFERFSYSARLDRADAASSGVAP